MAIYFYYLFGVGNVQLLSVWSSAQLRRELYQIFLSTKVALTEIYLEEEIR